MVNPITNKMLNQLLSDLGFKQGAVTENNHQIWHHPDSGCTLLLPANKSLEPPRPADLVGIKAQLDLQGHLDEESFNFFVAQGRLPSHANK